MNDEHSSMAMNSISHAALMVQHSMQQAISAYETASAIFRPKLSLDGNMWCALYGDNLQEGCAGFGETPALAMSDFDARWYGYGKYRKETK